jgi:hemoglobin
VELPDITRRADVHDLVLAFYRDVVFDDLLAPVFDEVAEVNWAEHIPKLIDFWCRVLLGQPGYAGAVLAAHRDLELLGAFQVEHLDRWYELWTARVDERWSGPLAELAKSHAARVGATLARQLLGVAWHPLRPPVTSGAAKMENS